MSSCLLRGSGTLVCSAELNPNKRPFSTSRPRKRDWKIHSEVDESVSPKGNVFSNKSTPRTILTILSGWSVPSFVLLSSTIARSSSTRRSVFGSLVPGSSYFCFVLR